jgi:hypothetical protein
MSAYGEWPQPVFDVALRISALMKSMLWRHNSVYRMLETNFHT